MIARILPALNTPAAMTHDNAGILATETIRRGLVSRLLLLGGSLAFIWLIAESVTVLAFIVAVVTTSFGVIIAADILLRREAVRRHTADLFVLLTLIGLIAANLSGGLSTLTGTSESLEGQLPLFLGISFYALQVAGVGYDVLRGHICRPRFLDYLVFVLLCFKFYSGPLERAVDLDRIVNRTRTLTLDLVWEGFGWVVLGFFFKFVIANPIVTLIDLDTYDPLSTVFVASVAELRIYFDFAGYSFMAVGLAKFAGIDLLLNFRQPLYAPNIAEFWRRWHVSIGRWLRHYAYLPLKDAVKRRGIPTPLVAPSVFFISALWHGATFNFALWGTIHAAAFLLYTQILSKRNWPPLLGHTALISLLIFVRLLYIDADSHRLAGKLLAFGDTRAWSGSAQALTQRFVGLSSSVWLALGLAVVVLVLEPISARIYRTLDYAIFRSVIAVAVMMILIFALARVQSEAIFVYARN